MKLPYVHQIGSLGALAVVIALAAILAASTSAHADDAAETPSFFNGTYVAQSYDKKPEGDPAREHWGNPG